MRNKFLVLIFLTLLCILCYMFTFNSNLNEYILTQRGITVLAVIIVGICIAVSTVIFQSITNNKILTPSIIGLDSLYIFVQTLLIFVLGSMHLSVYNEKLNFLLCLVCMVIFSIFFYKILFKGGRSLYFILLLGFIFGTFFSSLSLFFEALIDPDEFMIVQGRMFASFNNVHFEILSLATLLVFVVFIYIYFKFKYLDILALGKDISINLGLDYDNLVKSFIIVIAILTSISTALVGPISFLGLLVANISYELFKTYKHNVLLLASSLISIITLLGGIYIVSKVFAFNTTISVVINFIGGIYFIYLVLKGNRL
ncbi:iron chelate uptake ABC transporter family permease subunit [uncultured Campylobacter sp.]|uniref:iron chelate uptake ABC transporter family permease subunit n=1 Tax=uncultured Campylobacter sp. TaxID=218934 RepID=UPI00261CB890|nr:iron chelate uptake ABC transporter family permease subunit [uncultured Campylobacter sp.]